MQKAVLKMDLHDDRQRQKAFEAISTLHGIHKIEVDMEKQEMTVVDTVDVVKRLRKKRFPETTIVSVGPAKEEEEEEEEEKDGDNTAANNAPVYTPWYEPPHHPQTYCAICGSTRRCPCPLCT